MIRVALATSVSSACSDPDALALVHSLGRHGIAASLLAWDDPTVSWVRFDSVLLRSTWDYVERYSEFIDWCRHVDSVTLLLNPFPVVCWNTDKRYLADLHDMGIAVVPTTFVESDSDPLTSVQWFLAAHDAMEFVVKPAVGAGSRDTQRYTREQVFSAGNHVGCLLQDGRAVLLQPYLSSVDTAGETALVYFDGQFSHALRKGPMLLGNIESASMAMGSETIAPRAPADDELLLARQVLDAAVEKLDLDGPPAYARVDLIRDTAGLPRLLELELTEPSLFFDHAPGSAELFASSLSTRLVRHLGIARAGRS